MASMVPVGTRPLQQIGFVPNFDEPVSLLQPLGHDDRVQVKGLVRSEGLDKSADRSVSFQGGREMGLKHTKECNLRTWHR